MRTSGRTAVCTLIAGLAPFRSAASMCTRGRVCSVTLLNPGVAIVAARSRRTPAEIRRYRVDGVRVWERRDPGWFVHTYRYVPEQLVRVVTLSGGRKVSIHSTPHYERGATKQANWKEIRNAQRILDRDPLIP